MSDSNTQPRTVSSGNATQLIQVDAPARPQPLDLPKSSFGGYQPEATERLVAELQYRLSAAARNLEELNRAITVKQTENGRLNQRVADLTDENKRLKHAAENPVEALGQAGQALINAAKGQAADIRAKVRAEAEQQVKDSRLKADDIIRTAEKGAADTVTQARQRVDELDRQAQARVDQANKDAQHVVAEARDTARQLDAQSKQRAEQAQTMETRAKNAVVEAKATLQRLLDGLA